jgi:hypothetical protein
MTHEEWVTLGLYEQWRTIINSVIFKQACSVVLEELYQFRTIGSAETNALQNQFKEGTYSAIATFKALANPPHKDGKLPEMWARKSAKEELDKKLPPGPQKKELIHE